MVISRGFEKEQKFIDQRCNTCAGTALAEVIDNHRPTCIAPASEAVVVLDLRCHRKMPGDALASSAEG